MTASDWLKSEMERPGVALWGEDDLALRFAAEHGDGLRYVAEWSRWFEWDGRYWREDKTINVFDRIRTHCRAVAATCNEARKGMVRANNVAAVERLARADRHHALTATAWNTGPDILNTNQGDSHDR